MTDEGSQVRNEAAEALAGIGSAAVPKLADLADDPNREIRLLSIRALRRIGPAAAPAVPSLRRRLQDRDLQMRIEAIEALTAVGPAARSAIPDLRTIREADPTLRFYVEKAIARIEGRRN